MKLVLAGIFVVTSLGGLAYSLSSPSLLGSRNEVVVSERPDPKFDYKDASYDEKTAWMTKFAEYTRTSTESLLAKKNKKQNVSTNYIIDPTNGHLIVEVRQLKNPTRKPRKPSNTKIAEAKNLLTRTALSVCKNKLETTMLIDGVSVTHRAYINYFEAPLVEVKISKQICKNYLKSL